MLETNNKNWKPVQPKTKEQKEIDEIAHLIIVMEHKLKTIRDEKIDLRIILDRCIADNSNCESQIMNETTKILAYAHANIFDLMIDIKHSIAQLNLVLKNV